MFLKMGGSKFWADFVENLENKLDFVGERKVWNDQDYKIAVYNGV